MLIFCDKMKTLIALLALLAFSIPARALVDLQTLEQGCLWQVQAASFTNVTSKTVDLMGYGSVGYSSVTANAFAFDYTVYGSSDATYTVVQTTKTPNSSTSSSGFNSQAPWDNAASVAVLSTSTAVTVPANVWWPTTVRAYMKNPVWYFTSLKATATYYFQATYCQQQKP